MTLKGQILKVLKQKYDDCFAFKVLCGENMRETQRVRFKKNSIPKTLFEPGYELQFVIPSDKRNHYYPLGIFIGCYPRVD